MPKSEKRSKCSRAGDGNTASSPALHWLLTIDMKSINSDELQKVFQNIGVYYKFQGEKGNTTGYEHWQAYIHLKKKQRLTYWKKILPTAHAEKCNNINACKDYCGKETTAITPTYEWTIPKYPGVKIIKDEQLYKWQKDIIEIIKTEPDDRTIHWYWSTKGNTGKTQFCKYLAVKYDCAYVSQGKSEDIKFSIKDTEHKTLLIDLWRGTKEENVPYQCMEEIKNGVFLVGKYESMTTLRNSPHIFVFSNMYPNIDMLSEDRWHIVNLDTYSKTQ